MFSRKKLFTNTNTLVGLKSMTHETEIPETKSDNVVALKEHKRIHDVLTNIDTLLKNRSPDKIPRAVIYSNDKDELYLTAFYDRFSLIYHKKRSIVYNDSDSIAEFYLTTRQYGIYDRVIDILESFVLKII